MNKSCRNFVYLALSLAALGWASASRADSEYAGSEDCASCHEDVVASFRTTAHALAPGWKETRGCEACHGPAAAHVEAGGDVTKIARLTELGSKESSKVCTECHSRNETNFNHKSALHSLADVGCIDCHNPHSHEEKMLKEKGSDLCAGCHQVIVSQFSLPRAHPLASLDEGCASCHSPHANQSLRQREGFSTLKCEECHFEKAGPFLYAHDTGLVDGCQSCHQVHGSSNRHLLKHSRQINLCYQCHPGTTTPAFHSATSFLNEKCSACHTAIHGSNTNPYFLEE